jgi:uncharacterized protein (DUF885 family)
MSLFSRKPGRILLFAAFMAIVPASRAQDAAVTQQLHSLFDRYYQDYLRLYPLRATEAGDPRYNDQLPNEGAAPFIRARHDFCKKYETELKAVPYAQLNEADKVSYDILKDAINRNIEGERFHPEYMPVNQFSSLTLQMGQLGSGKGSQPFKTVKDYEQWISRATAFSAWTDTAIANFRKGMKAGIVLPRALVVKTIPQLESLAQDDVTKSVFYGPIATFPASFSAADKQRLTEAYQKLISGQLNPSYKKLAVFLKEEYLPKARISSGISALPDGAALYQYCIYNYTTTRKTPEELYKTGLDEVARITAEMERVKTEIGFKGSLQELFIFMKTDKQFMPFKTNKEVLDANFALLKKVEPHLSAYFGVQPKTPFEIREVEAFRAASAPPQYNQGNLEQGRPGIYYFPILDPAKVNVTGWPMDAVFLHEAIPGHHYQISLQLENKSLPEFRRNSMSAAFVEGWGLYAESLGNLLGFYTDPYQKLGAYGTEIHRAIRLVTDVALHTGKMNREEAIKYMMDHEAIAEATATLEIERYMAAPGQALSYKTGELKIKELRDRYQQQLGDHFSLKDFHDAILTGGAMPLDVFEKYMDAWAKKQ